MVNRFLFTVIIHYNIIIITFIEQIRGMLIALFCLIAIVIIVIQVHTDLPANFGVVQVAT